MHSSRKHFRAQKAPAFLYLGGKRQECSLIVQRTIISRGDIPVREAIASYKVHLICYDETVSSIIADETSNLECLNTINDISG